MIKFNAGWINPEHIAAVHPAYDSHGQYVMRVSLVGGMNLDLVDGYDVAKMEHFLGENQLVWVPDDPDASYIPPYDRDAMIGQV